MVDQANGTRRRKVRTLLKRASWVACLCFAVAAIPCVIHLLPINVPGYTPTLADYAFVACFALLLGGYACGVIGCVSWFVGLALLRFQEQRDRAWSFIAFGGALVVVFFGCLLGTTYILMPLVIEWMSLDLPSV